MSINWWDYQYIFKARGGIIKDFGLIQERIKAQVLPFFSPQIRRLLDNLSADRLSRLEEIRLRLGHPICLQLTGEEVFINASGVITVDHEHGYCAVQDDISRTLAAVSGNSVYALEEELKRGYITVKGGHRVGLAGKTIIENGQVKTMNDISSLVFRVAREVPGCADEVIKRITGDDGLPLNTLIISPPRCGKTTVLRDLARQYSNGVRGTTANVVIIDERSELAGCCEGKPQLDVGPRTDVLEGCPKAIGIVMAIRALAPQIVITDEVGRSEDVEAIQECLNAGVRIITSAHGSGLEDVSRRPVMQEILRQDSFQTVVIMSRRAGPSTIEKIIRLRNTGGSNDKQTGWSRFGNWNSGLDRPAKSILTDPAN
ncbi:MAG: stage III sporulation protein AA [Ignavibacteriales bacterium]